MPKLFQFGVRPNNGYSYLLFLLVNLVVFYPLFFGQGELIFRDFTFPILPEQFRAYHFPVWNSGIEKSNLDSIYRLFSRAPLLLLSYFFSVSTVLKIFLFLTIYVGQISFYRLLTEVVGIRSKFARVLLSLFFVLNNRYIDFLWETSLVVVYSLIPAILVVFERYFCSRDVRYLPLLSLLGLLVFVHPYSVIFLVVFCVYWVVWVTKTGKLWFRLRTTLLLSGIHLLLSAYFVLPFAYNWLVSGPLTPESSGYYTFDYGVVDHLSSSSFLDKLTLVRGVIQFVDYYPGPLALFLVWFFCSLLLTLGVPMYLFLHRITHRKVRILPLLLSYFLLFTLSFGSLGPSASLYKSILYALPDSFVWLFRSPLKLQLYAYIPLTILLALSYKYLEEEWPAVKVKKFANGALVIVLFVVSFSTLSNYFYQDKFVPKPVPQPYFEINEILTARGDGKVLYYPKYNERETLWGGQTLISPYDMISSPTPTINYWWSDGQVKDTLYDEIYAKRLFANLCEKVGFLGVKYLVFHNDRVKPFASFDAKALKDILALYRDNLIYEREGWYLFDLQCSQKSRAQKPNLFYENTYKLESALYPYFNVVPTPQNAFPTLASIVETRGSALPLETILPAQEIQQGAQVAADFRYLNLEMDPEREVLVSRNEASLSSDLPQENLIFAAPQNKSVVDLGSTSFNILASTRESLESSSFYEINGVAKVDPGTVPVVDLEFSVTNNRSVHMSYVPLDEEGERIITNEVSLDIDENYDSQTQTYRLTKSLAVPPQTQQVLLKIKGLVSEANEIDIRESKYTLASSTPRQIPLELDGLRGSDYLYAKILTNPLASSVETNQHKGLLTGTVAESGFRLYPLGKVADLEGLTIDGETILSAVYVVDNNKLNEEYNEYVNFTGCLGGYRSYPVTQNTELCFREETELVKDFQKVHGSNYTAIVDNAYFSTPTPYVYRAGLRVEGVEPLKINRIGSALKGPVGESVQAYFVLDRLLYVGIIVSAGFWTIYLIIIFQIHRVRQKV